MKPILKSCLLRLTTVTITLAIWIELGSGQIAPYDPLKDPHLHLPKGSPSTIRPSDLMNESGNITVLSKGLENVASIEKKIDRITNDRNVNICTGIVISEFIVLSSFNCVTQVQSISNELQVRVGSVTAENGGKVYNVYQSYGINLLLARPIPVKEKWGEKLTPSHNQHYRSYDFASPDMGRSGENPATKSINTPKTCEKSGPFDNTKSLTQEIFEAERYLGTTNPEFLILVTCESIGIPSPTGYAEMAFYKGPFVAGNAFLVSYDKNTKQMQKVLMANAAGPDCANKFLEIYKDYPLGPSLDERFQCITDRMGSGARRNEVFCNSFPGAPIFAEHMGRYQFQGVALYSRDCADFEANGNVILRLFDRQVARPISQILFE